MVSAKDLLEHAKHSKSSQAEVSHPRWPSGRVIDQEQTRHAYWVALGQGALCTLAASLTNEVSNQCDILLKPSRCVRLKEEVKAGGLALLPEGKVVFYPAEKTTAALGAGAVHLQLGVKDGPSGSDGAVAVAPAQSMESASPWWFVTTTKEASEANVEIVSF